MRGLLRPFAILPFPQGLYNQFKLVKNKMLIKKERAVHI